MKNDKLKASVKLLNRDEYVEKYGTDHGYEQFLKAGELLIMMDDLLDSIKEMEMHKNREIN